MELKNENLSLLPVVNGDDFIPSTSKWIRFSGLFIAAAVFSTVVLSAVIKYNVKVQATAFVRPTGELRLVQPELEGVIKTVEVKENQVIKKGDIIARLDDEQQQIKKSQLTGNIQQNKLQIAQIDAQIKSLEAQIAAESRVIIGAIATAKAELARSQKEYEERKTTTQSDLLSAQAGLQKAIADLQKSQADLNFAHRERLRYQQLAASGAIATREYDQKHMAWEQAKAAVTAESKNVEIARTKVKSATASTNPSQALVAIAQERITQESAKGKATIANLTKDKQALVQRRSEVQNLLIQGENDLAQLDNQLKRNVIRATSNGIIQRLHLRNSGQVVRVSDTLAEIAPNNTPLVIKAMVPSNEIKNVAVGQKVQMRVSACPYTDYGTLNGVVTAISPDAIVPNNNGSGNTNTNSYFETTIQPENIKFGRQKHQCQIQIGMEVKTDIISQEETVLRFVLRKARLLTDFNL
ncbi:hemolysin D [Calothrix sp. 336/3]|nr:hemolysin D [Calothrix sp. 336/3]